MLFLDNILHGFTDHDTTVPIRIHHESGEPHQHGIHFRTRRNIDESDEYGDSELNQKLANYSFVAFGEEFTLSLTPYSDFIAPSYSLQFIGNMTSSEAAPLEELPKHCFYSGHVNDDVTHTAVLSVCGGLVRGRYYLYNVDYVKTISFNYLHSSIDTHIKDIVLNTMH